MTDEQKQVSKEALKKSATILGGILAGVGVILLMLANGLDPLFATISFVGGLGLIAFGVMLFWQGAEMGELYAKQKGNLRDDEKGIVWVWVVAFLTWAIMAIAYFSLATVAYMILDSAEAMYPWGGEELGTLALTRNVLGWFLIIMTVGIIGWALINSARREDQTYPAY